MIINVPTTYEVYLTKEEDEKITDCIKLLTNMVKEVKEKDCIILENLEGVATTTGEIEKTIEALQGLRYLISMY